MITFVKNKAKMTHTETVKARYNKAERLLHISGAHLTAIRENERTSYVQQWVMSQMKRHQKVVAVFNEAKFQVGMLNPLTRSYFGAPPLED